MGEQQQKGGWWQEGDASATEEVWRGSSSREAGGGEASGTGEGMEEPGRVGAAAIAGRLVAVVRQEVEAGAKAAEASAMAERLVVEGQEWLERVSKGRQQEG